MRKSEDRKQDILNVLKTRSTATVSELAERFGVSKETIRLDLDYLEQKGFINRVFGGAVLKGGNAEIPFQFRKIERNDIKEELAKELIRHVPDDSVVYLTSSSTNLHLCNYLKLKKNLTIFTNSFEIVSALQDTKHTLIVIGGQFYNIGKRMIGPYAMEMIKDIYFDLCICGMDGCKDIDGPATQSQSEHLYIQKVLSQSRKKYLVSDQSKFSHPAQYKFAAFRDFDLLLFDRLSKQNKQIIERSTDARKTKLIELNI